MGGAARLGASIAIFHISIELRLVVECGWEGRCVDVGVAAGKRG